MRFSEIINIQLRIYNKILKFFYFLKLLPFSLKKKVAIKIKKERMDKEFAKLNLINKKNFLIVDPMPSEDFFHDYYSVNQWEDYRLKLFPIKKRDIEHFEIIKDLDESFNTKKFNILNFGSGHAGFSILSSLSNHSITNFDFFINEELINNPHITQINDLKRTSKKFDLIYASHSLEHVMNIKETIKSLLNISHKETIFFFEVPNCFNEKQKKIKAPHTYYFTRDFFMKLFLDNFNCETWKNSKKCSNDEGDIIRVYGKFRPSINFLNNI